MDGMIPRALALLIIALLSFGGIVHASMPHAHSDNAVSLDLFHSAAHPGTKDEFLAIVEVAFLALVILSAGFLAVSVTWTRARGGLLALLAALRRGVLPYRRFG
jgi:hypothetical protein